EDGQIFMCMDYYEGKTLDHIIQESPLPIEEACGIAIQVAEGLAKAHEKEIVHRDLKPSNLMLTKDGIVKILDFGLAKFAGLTKLTKAGTTLGTAAYMSPEQTSGEEVGASTDIWALGVVLYEMLTGEIPFKGDYEQAIMYAILNEDLNLKEKLKQFPEQLIILLEQSLQKDTSQRTASAAEFKTDLEKIQSQLRGLDGTGTNKVKRYFKPAIFIPIALAVLIASLLLMRQIYRSNRIRWARDVALPKIEKLTNEGYFEKNIEAFELAVEAEQFIPGDPKLIQFMQVGSGTLTIETQPEGAEIYRKPFDKPESDWEFVGLSPIVSMRMPLYLYRWKIVKPGYETQYRASWPAGEYDFLSQSWPADTLIYKLSKHGTLPSDMVPIAGTGEIADFLMDKYEVSNKQFKQFMDEGGYENKTYWKRPFIRNGVRLSREPALAHLRDMTGRLGPAAWEAGTYPEGEEDYPVSGISWYEAAAYAEFAGKSLPTITHWGAATEGYLTYINTLIYSMSNFSGKGPLPIGMSEAISSFGVHDMAGNVREWCWNESEKGRCIRGGAWNDVTYMFRNITQADPFDRSSKNGFRCVIYPERDNLAESLFEPRLSKKARNFYEETAVTDAVFDVYRSMFSYGKIDLKATIDKTDESSPSWIYQKISFSTPYENERMFIHLFLPRNATPPYQTIIYFPGAGSIYAQSSEDMEHRWEFTNKLSFLVKNGRAVVYPVYKSTFERKYPLGSTRFTDPHWQKDFRIKVIKEFKRVIDYLEVRQDIDLEKMCYFGFSWGGKFGSMIPAVEERIQLAITDVGGLFLDRNKPRPEVDCINYVSRVTIPTLMLNGKYDASVVYETSAKPMFDLLGTPHEDKRQILYESDHVIPRRELIKESLAWLDRYFGPVK
ncbi:MAG: protein kinase, partial [Verrucomicrobia bacterium]|nr:protein kinase [Verrucomicrobiota bacterium]